MNSVDNIVELQKQLTTLEHNHWLSNVVFTPNWWFLLSLQFLPWIIWWKFLDKSRIREILLYGFSLMIISAILDELGIKMLYWTYPYQLFQIVDRFDPVDLAVFPVTYMLIYQYASEWKTYLLAHGILAPFTAFIAEPFLVWLGIYKVLKWEFIYSLPIYFLIGVLSKLFIGKINKIWENNDS